MLDTGSIPVEGTRPVNQRAWYVYRMCKLCGSLRHWFSRGMAAISIVLAGLVFGCDARHDAGSRIDAEWHRSNLVDGLMAHWLQAAPTDSGFMRSSLNRQWKPNAEQPGHLTEQARLVYSLIIAYEVTKDRRYLDAATRGADFLLTRFRDPENGGYFLRLAQDGKPLFAEKNSYGHSFALLALSHMFRVTGDERYRKAALLTWNEINLWLRDGKGGFFGEVARNFSPPAAGAGGARSQNPLMHLFEALLALHDATHDPVALRSAKAIGDFVVNKLMQGTSDGGAYIAEWYDLEWKPLASKGEGGYTDIGHQFEWSHLLREAEQRGLSGVYAQTAERLLTFAVKVGYDESDGGVFTKLYPDGSLDRSKSWWQQTEAMRAFLMAATAGGHGDMWRRYTQTLGLVREQFVDKTNGGWYTRSLKECARTTCSMDQTEPYHMTALHMAALELAAKPQ